MQLIAMVLCLLVSVAARAQTPADYPGYHTDVRVYSSSIAPTPQTELWSAIFRDSEVEFDISPRSNARSFCIGTFFLNTPGNHGFVVHARDGDEKNERWFFVSKSLNRENWCFDARHSYRFKVWLLSADKGSTPKYGVDFEIEQSFPFVTDLRQGSRDFKTRGTLCAERFCSDVLRLRK